VPVFKKALLWFLLASSLLASVVAGRWEGAITKPTEEYLQRVIDAAEHAGAQVLIFELDTPGGLVSVTRDMVSAMAAASMPVVVYITPDGAQATSAGAVITLASDVAAMSPVSNIGAAAVVSMQQQMDETMQKKASEDMMALVRTLAERHDRNISAAEAMVRDAKSFTAKEAQQAGVIELIAADRAALLEALKGMTIAKHDQNYTIEAIAPVERVEANLVEEILALVTNPNFAYMLLMIGFYGLIIEFYNPGSMLPGLVGLIALSLGLYGLGLMGASWLGIALLFMGVVMFALEIFTPTFGLLSAAGAATMLAGSFVLFDPTSPFGGVALETIIFTVAVSAVIMGAIAYFGLAAQRRRVAYGKEATIGRMAEVTKQLAPKGKVFFDGETWNAHALEEEVIEAGEEVEIVAEEGLWLTVRRSQKSSAHAPRVDESPEASNPAD
jgi:membrane-bound serine protease (ClpP class)